MNTELKACRCGGHASIDDQFYGFVITCNRCYDGAPDAGPQMIVSGTCEPDAIDAWNDAVEEAAGE